MPLLFDSTFVLLLPALAFAMWAQWKVRSSYATYEKVGTRSGLSGADVAARVLTDSGISLSNEPKQQPRAASHRPLRSPGQDAASF